MPKTFQWVTSKVAVDHFKGQNFMKNCGQRDTGARKNAHCTHM